MSFGNIKKKKRLLALLLCTILAGASFMTGCGSKADENGSAQVSAEEKKCHRNTRTDRGRVGADHDRSDRNCTDKNTGNRADGRNRAGRTGTNGDTGNRRNHYNRGD